MKQAERIFDGREDHSYGKGMLLVRRFVELRCQGKRDIYSYICWRYYHHIIAANHEDIKWEHVFVFAFAWNYWKIPGNRFTHGLVDSLINHCRYGFSNCQFLQFIHGHSHLICVCVDEGHIISATRKAL